MVTAAVFNAGIILVFTVESWGVTAWLVFGPAFSVAVYVSIFTTEVVGSWLTVVVEIWATHIIFIFTATYGIFSIFVSFFIHNRIKNATEWVIVGEVFDVGLSSITTSLTFTANFRVVCWV